MAQDAFCFDDYDLDGLTEAVTGFGNTRYGFLVTPNTDHLVRLKDDPPLQAAYERADFVLLDSRFIALVVRLLRGLRLPVCTGSDLTAKLFDQVIEPDDALVLIGGSAEQARRLVQRFGLRRLAHYDPPMGFVRDAEAVEATLRFIEAQSPFRFCLLAVGSPQQEILAQRLGERGLARGLALCVGASVDFLTGKEQRAPQWMQRYALEWLYRLMQDPRRLAYRYLVRGPRIFPLLRRARILLRRPPRPSLESTELAA